MNISDIIINTRQEYEINIEETNAYGITMIPTQLFDIIISGLPFFEYLRKDDISPSVFCLTTDADFLLRLALLKENTEAPTVLALSQELNTLNVVKTFITKPQEMLLSFLIDIPTLIKCVQVDKRNEIALSAEMNFDCFVSLGIPVSEIGLFSPNVACLDKVLCLSVQNSTMNCITGMGNDAGYLLTRYDDCDLSEMDDALIEELDGTSDIVFLETFMECNIRNKMSTYMSDDIIIETIS